MNVGELGKVGVFMGGNAHEREISLKSGQAVLQALQRAGVQAKGFDVVDFESVVFAARQVDRVFIALHGRWGEDGHVQAILGTLQVPYTGSGVAASALAMDKLRTKLVWQGAGLPTPDFIWVTPRQPFHMKTFHQSNLTFPVMVKPCREGSSLGMTKVSKEADLEDAIAYAQTFDEEILIERWITGREFTVAILEHDALPVIELETAHEFYDFDAKYRSETTQYHCPVHLPSALQAHLQKLARQAFNAIGAAGWGRVDIMLDAEQNAYLIELNTVPGMTDHSLVPMAAHHAGCDFDTLVLRLLAQTKG